MRGHFSIEWLAQSSQASSSPSAPSGISPGPINTSGTRPESLPGFYCQKRTEKQDYQARRGQGLTPQNNPVLAGPETGTHPKRSSSLHQIHNHQVSEPGLVSVTDEEETSGYESEGGRSLSPIAPLNCTPTSPSRSPPSPPAGRRPRTVYTEEQINSLEVAFKRNAYLGTQEKAELCSGLNLTDKQIRNWFQNRRMRMKRMIQDALAHACQAKVASHLLHYPYRPGPYPACHPHHAGNEGGSAAPFLHPHYGSTPVGPGLTSLPTLDSFYQYTSLPSLVMPSTVSNPALGPYQTYTHQY
ncbi:ventrally expressed dharma/bozozok antagonist [Esox lucius]|nr:ventrally expressed dharma/bozozok antagonist [Esox lucius]